MGNNRYDVNYNEYQKLQESQKGDSYGYDYDPDIDFSSMNRMKGYSKSELKRFNDNLNYIYRDLRKNGYDDMRISAILGTIVDESHGDPYATSDNGTYHGLLQWGSDRYRINPFYEDSERKAGDKAELDRQLKLMYSTIDNLDDRKSWTHGGKGSGYMSARDAHDAWINAQDINQAVHAFNYGYVRPKGKDASVKNRTDSSNFVVGLMNKRAEDVKNYHKHFRYVGQYDDSNVYADGTDNKDGIDGGQLEPAIVKPQPRRVQLNTYPISKDYLISHSLLRDGYKQPGVYNFFTNLKPMIIDKHFDSTYNLLNNNCSDYTGRFLEDAYGVKLTDGITTPGSLKRKVNEKLSDSIIASGPDDYNGGYYQILEMPWYDYRVARDKHYQRLFDEEVQKAKDRLGDKYSERYERSIRDSFNNYPKLQFYLDENNEPVHYVNSYALGTDDKDKDDIYSGGQIAPAVVSARPSTRKGRANAVRTGTPISYYPKDRLWIEAENSKFKQGITDSIDAAGRRLANVAWNPEESYDAGAVGFTPIVGDVLQWAQAVRDLKQGNYAQAALGAGLLFVPNFIEKGVKYLGRSAKNALNVSPDVSRELKEIFDKEADLTDVVSKKSTSKVKVIRDPHLEPSHYSSHGMMGFELHNTLNKGWEGIPMPSIAVQKHIKDIDDSRLRETVNPYALDIALLGGKKPLYGGPIYNGDAYTVTFGDIGLDPDNIEEALSLMKKYNFPDKRIEQYFINNPNDLAKIKAPYPFGEFYREAKPERIVPFTDFDYVVMPQSNTANINYDDMSDFFTGKGLKVYRRTVPLGVSHHNEQMRELHEIVNDIVKNDDSFLFRNGGRVANKNRHVF